MKRAAAVLAAFLLLGAACAQEDEAPYGKKSAPEGARFQGIIISDLLRSAGSYHGKEIMISGKVTTDRAAESSDGQSFMLDDGTGSLLVVTKEAVPGDNQWVTVRGRVDAPFQAGEGRRGIALKEAQVQ
jgi:hypothetical protein